MTVAGLKLILNHKEKISNLLSLFNDSNYVYIKNNNLVISTDPEEVYNQDDLSHSDELEMLENSNILDKDYYE